MITSNNFRFDDRRQRFRVPDLHTDYVRVSQKMQTRNGIYLQIQFRALRYAIINSLIINDFIFIQTVHGVNLHPIFSFSIIEI